MEQSILKRLLGPAQENAEDWGKGHGPPLNLPPLRNQNVAADIEARRSENLDTKLWRYLTDVVSRSSSDREFSLQQLLNLLSSVSGSDAESCRFAVVQIFPRTQGQKIVSVLRVLNNQSQLIAYYYLEALLTVLLNSFDSREDKLL